MSSPRVGAVVVSYNVRDLLLSCVASLVAARAAGEVDEIVVIDSGSHDGSIDAVRRSHPDVCVVGVENRGYGAAVNRGVGCTTAEYILALNPDTVVAPGAVATLASYLDAHPSVAIAGPRLRYPDGREQPSRRRFPGRCTPLFESTFLHRRWPGNPWARAYYMDDIPPSGAQIVDWVVGACLLIRRDAIDACGGFDESFFLYAEEVELCWRYRRHGWRVAWVPGAEVMHYEAASSGQNSLRRQLLFDAGRVRLAGQMYGTRTAAVVRIGLLAGYAAELTVETAKWAVGHKRALRRSRMRYYASALCSGLRDVQ